MFEEWGFLIAEIWGLLALAALAGLLAGWLIRGRSGAAAVKAGLRHELERLRAEARLHDDRIVAMQAELSRARTEAAALAAKEKAAAKMQALSPGGLTPAALTPAAAEILGSSGTAAMLSSLAPTEGAVLPPAEMAGAAAPAEPAAPDAEDIGDRPEILAAPRGGRADDLKRIHGIGPKIEALLHRLGVFHFDQIAGWSDAEIAWVDANLDTFKGRIIRDGWVAQARTLAEKPPAGG